HNAVTAVTLRARPSSRGTVRLTGPHPQDLLQIDKQHFQAPGGRTDVAALRDGVKKARALVKDSLLAVVIDREIFPGANFSTDEEIERHVYENIFGHHACCTAKIGADNDQYAVLDGDFNVRGVSNLRVVDISAWPNVPGFFVTTPTYMMAEKAARVIIEAANGTATGASNDTFVDHAQDALQALQVFLTSAGIQVGNLLDNVLHL
ncbi:GMC oxidoreductase-domain-containing protein, partial [Vararia minispora EC-137]